MSKQASGNVQRIDRNVKSIMCCGEPCEQFDAHEPEPDVGLSASNGGFSCPICASVWEYDTPPAPRGRFTFDDDL